MYYIGNKLSEEEAKEFNRNIQEAKLVYGGCIGSRACEKCFTIISGTCMCMPMFTCPVCGFSNGSDFKFNIDISSIGKSKMYSLIYTYYDGDAYSSEILAVSDNTKKLENLRDNYILKAKLCRLLYDKEMDRVRAIRQQHIAEAKAYLTKHIDKLLPSFFNLYSIIYEEYRAPTASGGDIEVWGTRPISKLKSEEDIKKELDRMHPDKLKKERQLTIDKLTYPNNLKSTFVPWDIPDDIPSFPEVQCQLDYGDLDKYKNYSDNEIQYLIEEVTVI